MSRRCEREDLELPSEPQADVLIKTSGNPSGLVSRSNPDAALFRCISELCHCCSFVVLSPAVFLLNYGENGKGLLNICGLNLTL